MGNAEYMGTAGISNVRPHRQPLPVPLRRRLGQLRQLRDPLQEAFVRPAQGLPHRPLLQVLLLPRRLPQRQLSIDCKHTLYSRGVNICKIQELNPLKKKKKKKKKVLSLIPLL